MQIQIRATPNNVLDEYSAAKQAILNRTGEQNSGNNYADELFGNEEWYTNLQQYLKQNPPQMPPKEGGNLHGLKRYLSLLALGTADFAGSALMGAPAKVLGNAGEIQDNLTNRTNAALRSRAAKLGIPTEALDDAFPDEDSLATALTKKIGDVYSPYKRNMDEAYRYVAGDTPLTG